MPCTNIAQVKAKGREAYLEQKNVDAAEFNEMLKQVDEYKAFAARRKLVQEQKAEANKTVGLIVASGDGHTRRDF